MTCLETERDLAALAAGWTAAGSVVAGGFACFPELDGHRRDHPSPA